MAKTHLHIMIDNDVHSLLKLHIDNVSEFINGYLRVHFKHFQNSFDLNEEELSTLEELRDSLMPELMGVEQKFGELKNKVADVNYKITAINLLKKQQEKIDLKKELAILEGVKNARLHGGEYGE